MGTLSDFDPQELLRRVLEETDDANDDDVEDAALIDGNDAVVLKNTLRVYGTFFVIVLIIFSYLRRKYPRVYNLRNWVEDLKTPLAQEKHGFFSWMWKLFLITDSEMMDECGMDALCYARVLEFGLRVSCVGILNALWLIPVYLTAETTAETAYIEDPIVSISVSHLPSGSYRFCATVVGAYVVFGFTMHSILQEFEWFIMFRNQFLSKKLPRNYSVYVRNIPQEYCTPAKFLDFFQQSSSGAVLEARLAIKTPGLKKKVAQREKVVAKLEHKINVEEVRGVTPMQRRVTGPSVNAIDALYTELRGLNKDISKTIDQIEQRNYPRAAEFESMRSAHSERLLDPSKPLLTVDCTTATLEGVSFDELGEENLGLENPSDALVVPSPPVSPDRGLIGSIFKGASKSVKQVASSARTGAIVDFAGHAVDNVKNSATAMLFQEDGEPQTAGFLTFKTLRAAQAAKQLIQYPEPFAMEVLEAPQPEGKSLGCVLLFGYSVVINPLGKMSSGVMSERTIRNFKSENSSVWVLQLCSVCCGLFQCRQLRLYLRSKG
jgi:hypothetical protein